MNQITPSYKNDEISGPPKEIRDFLDKNFFNKLGNLHTPNPKVLIVFSGGSALGKSTLSRKIEQGLKAIVLENDAIKSSLLSYNQDISRKELNLLTWQYSMDLYSRLDSLIPNGLIVRDGVIDWYYDRILPIFEKCHYSLFVIGYAVSKQKQIELIKKRGDKEFVTTERLIELSYEQDIHTARFRAKYIPNVVLTDENLFDHEKVIEKLKTYLAQLNH